MFQATLFGHDHLAQVVNVASVPQRSPFRYPGGKTWLVPRIRHWLASPVRNQYGLRPERPAEFVEPFAGGGIVSLTVAAERLADHVTMAELDPDVSAVWSTALDPEGAEWLANRILTFDLTLSHVKETLNQSPSDTRDRAFQTILKNRVYHGGILAPGSGLIKQGEAGRGLASRWYPQTLARRIRQIAVLRDRISFIQGDGLDVTADYITRQDAVIFLDPPYTVRGRGKRAGKRLYTYCDLDHERLFDLAAQTQGDFLMTYDDAPEVRRLAYAHNFDVRAIPMKNTHHAKMNELLMGHDLSWVFQEADITHDIED
jgi:DNA adenine methylase